MTQANTSKSPEREKYYLAAIVVWGIFFTCLYSLLSRETAPPNGLRIFNSPDETANYYFTKLWAEDNRLSMLVPRNQEFGNSLYPRSTTVLENGQVAPGSFLGLIIIYGLIAKFFGSWIILYLTPLISWFGFICLYQYLKRIFSADVAFGSVMLLMIFPPWMYYNSRSMFHNVLFVNLVIFCLYHLQRYFETKKAIRFALSVAFLFLALFTRTVEALWLVPVFLLALVLGGNFKGVWKARIWSLIAVAASIAAIAAVQLMVFASPWAGGYAALKSGTGLAAVQTLLFPFGFDFSNILRNALAYGMSFFWWYSLAAILGLIWLLKNMAELTHEQRMYIGLHLTLTWVLVVYYGSWMIADNLNTRAVTLGSSYIRYWLPSFVLAMPYAAYAVFKVVNIWPKKLHRRVAGALIIILFVTLSIDVAYFKTDESLMQVRQNIYEYYVKRAAVNSLVEEDAVIVTDRSDKIFFPGRDVMTEPYQPHKIQVISNMVAVGVPVYWYTHVVDKDALEYNARLAALGLTLGPKAKIFTNESLYPITALSVTVP